MLRNDRYIGGGRLFYKEEGKWLEFGEVQELSLNFNIESKEAFSKDEVITKKVDQVITKLESKISFSTQKVNIANLKKLFYATQKEAKAADVNALLEPTGKRAKTSAKPVKLEFLKNPIQEMPILFIGDSSGDTIPVLELPLVSIKPKDDFSFITDEFVKLGFEGDVIQTGGVFANEYFVSKADVEDIVSGSN